MTHLLDINVLVALFDSAHVHHHAAHKWLAEVGRVSWATCPITENGFVRVVSNPAYTSTATSPMDAIERLRVFATSRNMCSGRMICHLPIPPFLTWRAFAAINK